MRRMYDSVTASKIPQDAELVAGYVDGAYAWSEADWALWAHVPHVRIAVLPTTNDGNCADVEAQDMTPTTVVDWVVLRRRSGVDPSVYCSLAPWPEVRQAFDDRGVAQPHYWIASWDGSEAIPAGAVAKQYLNGADYDSSAVGDYWPGVDPVIDYPPPGPGPEDLTEVRVRQIIDRYLATELGQGDSAQALIQAILARIEGASEALDLSKTAPTKS